MRRLITYFKSHIRFKIIFPFAVLTIVVAVTGAYLSTRLVSGSLEERFTRQLIEAASTVADGLAQREQLHLSTFRAIAFTEGVGEAITTNDREKLETLVLPHVINNNIGLVEVVDANGTQLLEIRRPPGSKQIKDYIRRADGDLIEESLVQKALSGIVDFRGDKHVAFATVAGQTLFLTAGPVKQGEAVVGVVVVGSYTYDLLRSLAQSTFAEVSFYDLDGNLVDTTFTVDSQQTTTAPAIDPRVRNLLATEGGADLHRAVSINGRNYNLLFNVLHARGEPLGFYSVALQTTFIDLQGNTARNQMFSIFAVTLLLVFGIGYFTANVITGQVRHLMENARAVASGDFSRRTELSSTDEIGLLARSLDDMTESLANYTDALQNRIDELIALYESSSTVAIESGLDLDHALQTITTSVNILIQDTVQVVVYLLDEQRQTLQPRAFAPPDKRDFPTLSFAENSELQKVLESFEPHLISRATLLACIPPDSIPALEIPDLLIAPLVVGQEIIGMLALVPGPGASTSKSLDQASARLLGTLANQAAVAIKNAQLFEMTQRAYEELRQLDDLKTKFINIAAHELRTPLGAMMGYASFLEKRSPPKLRQSTRFLMASTMRMRTMVDAMLAIQRLDAGTAFLRMAPVDIRDIVNKTCADFQPIADLEGHTLKVTLPDQLPAIEADAEKVSLVLSNLLSNAVKFTPPGGCIEIAARDYLLGVVVSVGDNGVGIDDQDQKRIFERFYQVRPEHIAGHGGIGIGLTIVKHLVELHRGQIWVESELNKGSTFFFTLPREKSDQAGADLAVGENGQANLAPRTVVLESLDRIR